MQTFGWVMKKQSVGILIIIFLCPLAANAVTFDDMLIHHPSNAQPFWGYIYKNIKWVSHMPAPAVGGDPEEGEADYRGQIDRGLVDLNGDGKKETIKVIWGEGVSDHSLTIELYEDNKKFATLQPKGIQPNFKVEDLDSDGSLEVTLWGAIADSNMSQDISDESKAFEAHSVSHLFLVDIYKLKKGKCIFLKEYVTKNKYEPFFAWEQRGLPE